MQRHNGRLEVTTLSWEYKDAWQDGFRQGCRRANESRQRDFEGKPKREYFFQLPDHVCDYGKNECGIYVIGIEIHVGNDGNGSCDILHPQCTRSGCDHELQILGQYLRQAFTNEEELHVGGGGVTSIDFGKRSGEALTDTAMQIYKKLITIFGVKDEDVIRYMKGPRVIRRSYFWSTDLNGWVSFEDRLARSHGLRPINESQSQFDKKPFDLFRWP